MFIAKSSIVVVLLYSMLGNVFASAKSETEKLKSYCQNSEHLNISEKITDKDSGKEYYYFYIKIKSSVNNKEKVVDCSYFGVGPVLAEKLVGIENYSGKRLCAITEDHSNLKEILKLELNIRDVVSKVSCSEKEKTPILSGKCGKQLGCNLLRSAFQVASLGSYHYLSDLLTKGMSKEKKLCLNSKTSDCMTEAVTGIVKNIWFNIEGIGYLLKSAGTATWNGLKSFGNSLFGSKEAQAVEDKSSEAMHMAGSESESSLKLFARNPQKFMVAFGKKIYNFLMKAAGDSFGCAKWEGVPHLSKCLKVLDSWQCSTCDQRINALCGVAGFVGGEIVTSFLTGSTINLVGKAGKAAGLGKAFAAFGRATKDSKVVAALAKGGEYAGKAISYPFTALAKIPGLKQFLHANEVAFLRGLRGGKKAASAVAIAKKSSVMDDVTSVPVRTAPAPKAPASTAAAPAQTAVKNLDKTDDALKMINAKQYNSLPDGTVFQSANGTKYIKGQKNAVFSDIPEPIGITKSDMKYAVILKRKKLLTRMPKDKAYDVIQLARKDLSRSVHQQLSAIDRLDDLRVDLLTKAKKGATSTIHSEMMGAVEDLAKLVKETTNEKVRIKAMNTLVKFARENSGHYKLGKLGQKSPQVLDDIYKNTDLPEEIRKIAYEETRKAGFASTPKFKTSEQLIADKAAAEKLNQPEMYRIRTGVFPDAPPVKNKSLIDKVFDFFD